MQVGEYAANCYVISNGGRGIVIDPGSEGEAIVAVIKEQALSLEAIFNTHGHFDHIGANGTVKAATQAALYIHRGDELCLRDGRENLSVSVGFEAITSPPADHVLSGGEILQLAGLKVQILHTPGHSRGSICLYIGEVLFTGDTLFAGSIGRADFPGASGEELMDSLRNILMPLPSETVIYPGHGPASTIGREKRDNPFLC